MVSSICFICSGYPTKDNPKGTFVGELIRAFADLGITCTVISPCSITNAIIRRERIRPYRWVDITDDDNQIIIYQPKVISFSNCKILKPIASAFSRKRIVQTFKKKEIEADIIYAHFWVNGASAGLISAMTGVPFVVANGEDKINIKKIQSYKNLTGNLKNLIGVISVSTKNMDESKRLGFGDFIPYAMIPNAVNTNKFHKMDRDLLREKHNFPKSSFIISFVGSFDVRKGPQRILDAVRLLNDSDIKIVFIGDGPQKPKGAEVLFSNRVGHEFVAELLNCSDIFVLPTLAEGCSNAIVEAMACGLPIVSSDLPFNHDILDKENSILIDPMNVKEISDAIDVLKKDSKLRSDFGKASLKKSIDFSINIRAKKILNFIESNLEKHDSID